MILGAYTSVADFPVCENCQVCDVPEMISPYVKEGVQIIGNDKVARINIEKTDRIWISFYIWGMHEYGGNRQILRFILDDGIPFTVGGLEVNLAGGVVIRPFWLHESDVFAAAQPSSVAYLMNQVNRYDLEFNPSRVDGAIRLYHNGNLAVEQVGDLASPPDLVFNTIEFASNLGPGNTDGGTIIFSGVIISDSDTRNLNMIQRKPVSVSAPEGGWTGGVAEINRKGINVKRFLKGTKHETPVQVEFEELEEIDGTIKAVVNSVRANSKSSNHIAVNTAVELEETVASSTIFSPFSTNVAQVVVEEETSLQDLNETPLVISTEEATVEQLPFDEYVVFKSNDSYVVPAGVETIDVLVLGAGGSGGRAYYTNATSPYSGGGGGAGGLLIVNNIPVNQGDTFPITIGTNTYGVYGNSGGSTLFGDYVAQGGAPGATSTNTDSRMSGGASAGGPNVYPPTGFSANNSTVNQIQAGGSGIASKGKSATVSATTKAIGGAGGRGRRLAELGWGGAVAYGAPPEIGGGGGSGSSAGGYSLGGLGGGGRGGSVNTDGEPGTPNTGGGGGGGGASTSSGVFRNGKIGGSGLVIVRQKKANPNAFNFKVSVGDGGVIGADLNSQHPNSYGRILNPISDLYVAKLFDDPSSDSATLLLYNQYDPYDVKVTIAGIGELIFPYTRYYWFENNTYKVTEYVRTLEDGGLMGLEAGKWYRIESIEFLTGEGEGDPE